MKNGKIIRGSETNLKKGGGGCSETSGPLYDFIVSFFSIFFQTNISTKTSEFGTYFMVGYFLILTLL